MDSYELNTFGALLKQFRNRRGIKQEALAYKIGKQSRGNIDAWERGLYLPSNRDVVLDLAKALSLSENETDQFLLAAHHFPEFQALGTKTIESQKVASLSEPPL